MDLLCEEYVMTRGLNRRSGSSVVGKRETRLHELFFVKTGAFFSARQKATASEQRQDPRGSQKKEIKGAASWRES